MVQLQLSNELVENIQNEATVRGKTIEEYLQALMRRERTLSERKIIQDQQEWWLALPLSKRTKYEEKYIAVHDKTLVDFDSNETTLRRRVRIKYGKKPVLIMPAEGPQEIRIFSPRIQH
ncbi:MAG: hypothetical protein AAF639_16825 [Chloroflexota bacterium]